MIDDTTPTLRIREDLYVSAMAFLGDLEGRLGDDVEPFDISTAGHKFVSYGGGKDTFEAATGRPLSGKEREMTDRFFMGIKAPTHYNQSLEQYADGIWDVDEDAAAAIRDIVFALTTAWAHRYGGISHCRVVNGVVRSLGEE